MLSLEDGNAYERRVIEAGGMTRCGDELLQSKEVLGRGDERLQVEGEARMGKLCQVLTGGATQYEDYCTTPQ